MLTKLEKFPKQQNTLLPGRRSHSTAIQSKRNATVQPNFKTTAHSIAKTFLLVAAALTGVSSYAGDHEAVEEIRDLKDMTQAKPKFDTDTMSSSWTSNKDDSISTDGEINKLRNGLDSDLKDEAPELELPTLE